jgi:hypothetical protein
MRIERESVIRFTSDYSGWRARFRNREGLEWAEDVVGWAVVVSWASWADKTIVTPEVDDLVETRIEAVVLAENKYLLPVSDYVRTGEDMVNLVSLTGPGARVRDHRRDDETRHPFYRDTPGAGY